MVRECCWVHKTANVLNSVPKSQQPKAKRALQEIWMAETKKDALAAFDAFVEVWGVKYDEAVECLTKDREALLVFYDFPAEHWKHLRTTNVIESSFATIRHRTVRSKGCLSNKTALAMIFKLAEAAEKSWRRLDAHNQLPKVILGVRFADGIEITSQSQVAAAWSRPSPTFDNSSSADCRRESPPVKSCWRVCPPRGQRLERRPAGDGTPSSYRLQIGATRRNSTRTSWCGTI